MSSHDDNILFATPPVSREERYGTLAAAGSSVPALGILMLAAVARRAGHAAAVIDAAALNLSEAEFLRRVAELRPRTVGFSATTLSVSHAARTAARIRELLPDVSIIIGGPHASAIPVETLETFPVFDLAVLGEGEQTVVELLNNRDGDPGRIPGLVLRQGNSILPTDRRPWITDLDTLPFPAWDLLEDFPSKYAPPIFKTRRLPAASLVTSRGCPNRCIFCDRSVFGSSCHAFSADYVVSMMEQLYRDYGVREFSFEDDTFVTFRTRLAAICEKLIRLRLPVSWSCLGRVNQVNAELLPLMKRAGCWQISFGVESGNEQILERIRKNVTLEEITRAVMVTRQAGLRAKGFFIVGHPGETKQSLRQTIDFSLRLPLNDISVSMLTPFPGTELHARAAEFGAFDGGWERMSLLNPVFIPFGLTEADLLSAQREMMKKFYFRPSVFIDYLGRVAANPAMIGGLGRSFVSFARSVRR